MTNNYQNITDNPDNYGTARFISWGLMIPSFVAYALLTWCYFEDPEMLTNLFNRNTVVGGAVKPIPTRGTDYAHHSTRCPPRFLDLATALKNILWKYFLVLLRPLIFLFTYIVRYVKAKSNPNDFSQYQRYEDCRRLWAVIRRVEIGVENTGQLILQLWLFRPYINLVLNWSFAEVLR